MCLRSVFSSASGSELFVTSLGGAKQVMKNMYSRFQSILIPTIIFFFLALLKYNWQINYVYLRCTT